MQRIIQINIGGRLISMEDEAYTELKSYLASVHHQFAHEDGKDEILEDIESRISELFQSRLQSGAAAITMQDVRKVAEILGAAHQLGANDAQYKTTGLPATVPQDSKLKGKKRLYRNANEKMIAGVSAGIADYFNIDPVLIRLAFFLTAFFALGGLVTYIVCWVILPVGSPEDIAATKSTPPNYNAMKQSVVTDLQDLKLRAEKMSVELKEWFDKQKW